MEESRLTRREALTQAGKVAVASALLASPLSVGVAEPAGAAIRCHESVKKIISVAAVAEALAVTFYYNGITHKVGTLIEPDQLDYLKAALAEEKDHLDLLRKAGAAAPPKKFFFEMGTFAHVRKFTDVLDALETAFIGAYAAAVHRFCELNQADLAELAARILGIEAEHRVLGRDIAGASPPNNLCLERVPFVCVSEAADALAPFLSDGPKRKAFTMPTNDQVRAKSIPCE